MSHRLATVLAEAVRGRFPPPDGSVEVLPPPPGPAMGVVAFSGRYLIASSASEEWVRGRLPGDDLGAAMSPAFLVALGQELGRREDGLDAVLAAPGLPGDAALREVDPDGNARAERARAHREEVRAFEDEAGVVVVLGRGLAGRLEVSLDVEEAERGRGRARSALREARRLVGPDGALFAQMAPGNAASLRAALGAGFVPIGSEVLFFA